MEVDYETYDDLDPTEKARNDRIFEEHEKKCPRCGRSDGIEVAITTGVVLVVDGTDMDEADNGDHEYDSDSGAHCQKCDFTGTVGMFEGKPVADLRELAFKRAAAILRDFEPALANEIEHGCLHLHPGEPFFALRAQDVSAPGVVDHWSIMNNSSAPTQKIAAAHDVADRMRKWSGPRKDPD